MSFFLSRTVILNQKYPRKKRHHCPSKHPQHKNKAFLGSPHYMCQKGNVNENVSHGLVIRRTIHFGLIL